MPFKPAPDIAIGLPDTGQEISRGKGKSDKSYISNEFIGIFDDFFRN
jgi:hypothetical protein